MRRRHCPTSVAQEEAPKRGFIPSMFHLLDSRREHICNFVHPQCAHTGSCLEEFYTDPTLAGDTTESCTVVHTFAFLFRILRGHTAKGLLHSRAHQVRQHPSTRRHHEQMEIDHRDNRNQSVAPKSENVENRAPNARGNGYD
jgi:hypothetical protein